MKMTEHFDSEEFDCHDGTPYPEDKLPIQLAFLCKALEKIRAKIGRPIYILSGYRTPSWNKIVSGTKFSRHIKGDAADIVTYGMSPVELFDVIDKMMEDKEIDIGGLGFYSWGVHYDQRGTKARW